MPVKLKSRKFWMAVVTAILIVLNEGLGLDLPKDSIIALASVVIAYILGESYVDARIIESGKPGPVDRNSAKT